MKKTLAVLAVLVALPVVARAQKPVTETDAVEVTAKIEAIDKTARLVTLKDKDGDTETIKCGPEVKRFDELKVGDTVTFRYYESIAYAIRKPGQPSGLPAQTGPSVTRGAGPEARRNDLAAGNRDGHAESHRREGAVGDRPDRRRAHRELQGRGQENLQGVKVGDKVEVTYTEAVMISVK